MPTPDTPLTEISVHCSRCGTEAKALHAGNHLMVPEGWEGTVSDAVCPGCQYAEWHPHCTAIRADYGYGARVDLDALRRDGQVVIHTDTQIGEDVPVIVNSFEELEHLGVGWCDHIDLGVSWIDDADMPQEWKCPECGGTEFEGVHRDYGQSNLKGTSFDVSVEEKEGDGDA